MMINKRIKSKMKSPNHNLVLINLVLLFVIQTSSEQTSEHFLEGQIGSNNNNKLKYRLDPSDLMPSDVDLSKLRFKNSFKFEDQTDNQENKADQFINLVSSNEAALPLKAATNDKIDNFNVETYNKIPSIVLENVYKNDLTKIDKVYSNELLDDDQTYSNYLPETSLTKDFKQIMPNIKLTRDQLINSQQTDLQKKQSDEQNFFSNFKTINQLDSKINLSDVLEELNILIDSNIGHRSSIIKKQRKIIRKNSGILAALDKGLKLSLDECKFQFKNNYWNCPTNRKLKGKEMYGKILDRACRETSFLSAIRSAGITYAITKACSDGLIRTCSCDYSQNINYFSDSPGQSLFTTQYSFLKVNHANELGLRLGIDGIGGNVVQSSKQEYTSDFKWSGCSDNIKFASKIAKQMLDWFLKNSSTSVQNEILIHNYEAGRRAVTENMILVCKCHGMSGTCTLRTCWRRLSSFRKVGTYLKDRYNSAVQVVQTNDGQTLVPKEENISPPTNLDLYFNEASPQFCIRNLEEGSLGTSGRQCDPETSGNSNSCDQLCCGRGYKTRMKSVKYRCNCQFEYCCHIKCDTCKKIIKVYECV